MLPFDPVRKRALKITSSMRLTFFRADGETHLSGKRMNFYKEL